MKEKDVIIAITKFRNTYCMLKRMMVLTGLLKVVLTLSKMIWMIFGTKNRHLEKTLREQLLKNEITAIYYFMVLEEMTDI